MTGGRTCHHTMPHNDHHRPGALEALKNAFVVFRAPKYTLGIRSKGYWKRRSLAFGKTRVTSVTEHY
ncbi:hypothetical protein P4H39_18965 [Paenibacillus lautus]|uniref:hypothetical protein n=1 Tax=Paenibacillus lautus TaxID=1401 RepID=UPI002DBB73BF|nr:hypothetical protein [Paenibacillus lautus]MEC0204689.1 hypothetical protein [Paenibacillus lautus]